MMSNYSADWIFNFALKLASVVCLSTLALGLITGADPLTALLRSSIAFVSFVVLGWAASLLWHLPEVQQAEVETDLEENMNATLSAAAPQPETEE